MFFRIATEANFIYIQNYVHVILCLRGEGAKALCSRVVRPSRCLAVRPSGLERLPYAATFLSYANMVQQI